jgi:MoaA/NifB/PqqE/SkfB family radical SAM enzyme
MKDKKYFCYEIYKNLAVWSRNGKLAYNPCIFFKGYIKLSDQFNLTDVWNSPEHQQLKHCVENDIPIKGCQSCYNEEDNGLVSRRMGSRKLYEEFHQDTELELDGPAGLDYSVGNLCNLKCVICDPGNSAKWIPDYQKLYPLKSIEPFQFEKHNQIEITDLDALKNIKNVHFHGGGEPLMASNHVNLLKRIDQVKGLADVRVFYNVNATVTVEESVLKLWEKCKLVELYFSIDDIGARFNYQRTGAVWNHVVDNLKWYYERMPHNHMFNINCTWSYLNLFYLDELYNWYHENFTTNRYGDPTNLILQKGLNDYSLDHISQSTYNVLVNKFKDYPTLLEIVNSLEINDQLHTKFWNNVTALDQVRSTNFKMLCPEWSQLIL